MKVWRILFVLSALTTKGYSILCRNCLHFGTGPCTQPLVSCSADQMCVTVFTEVRVENTVTPEYSMSCGTRSVCNITGSLTFINGKIRTATSCCSTDNCTVPTPQLPVGSQVKNGLTCRTCSSNKSNYCYTGDKMECTGDETKCGRMDREISGIISMKDAARGCATRTFCDILGNQKISLSGFNVDMEMHCSDGTSSLYNGLIYAVTSALLAKLLF